MADYLLEQWGGPGDHGARPAVTDVSEGALWCCTDDNVVEINDGAAWVEWFDPHEDQT